VQPHVDPSRDAGAGAPLERGASAQDEGHFRKAIRRREHWAWQELVRLYADTIARRAGRLLTRTGDARDVLGEMWHEAYRQAHGYDVRRLPLPWLLRICANHCLKRLRRKGLFARFLQDPRRPPGAPEAEVPRDPDHVAEARRALGRALAELPDREREVVTLRYAFDVSIAEIAELLGSTVGAVTQAGMRGLEHLREAPSSGELQDWLRVLSGEEGR
jgi:RNA polymerase sigma-70 factor (ECF subfamily)